MAHFDRIFYTMEWPTLIEFSTLWNGPLFCLGGHCLVITLRLPPLALCVRHSLICLPVVLVDCDSAEHRQIALLVPVRTARLTAVVRAALLSLVHVPRLLSRRFAVIIALRQIAFWVKEKVFHSCRYMLTNRLCSRLIATVSASISFLKVCQVVSLFLSRFDFF